MWLPGLEVGTCINGQINSSKCAAYGSMINMDSNFLVEAFTKACNDGGNQPAVGTHLRHRDFLTDSGEAWPLTY